MTRGLGCACASCHGTETEHAKRTNIRIPIRLMDILLVLILFCLIGLRKRGPRPKRGPDGLRGKNCHTRGEVFVFGQVETRCIIQFLSCKSIPNKLNPLWYPFRAVPRVRCTADPLLVR